MKLIPIVLFTCVFVFVMAVADSFGNAPTTFGETSSLNAVSSSVECEVSDETSSYEEIFSSEEVTTSEEKTSSEEKTTSEEIGLLEQFLKDIFTICHHEEEVYRFSFSDPQSTAMSTRNRYCANCNWHLGYSYFRGDSPHSEYLDVVREFMDSEKIIGGEYYTMKATYRLPDFDSNKTWIRCVVQKGNILVGFTANFKEEFEEELDLLEEGQEVTFRGRLYDKGFGFTDCELITN